MESLVSVIQNSVFVLSLGVLYDMVYRIRLTHPKLPYEVLVGGIFCLMITLFQFTPVIYFERDIHVGFSMLIYASLMGGWIAGGMSLTVYIGLDMFIFNDPITVSYLIFVIALTALGYALRWGYKTHISDYHFTEFIAISLVVMCLHILLPLALGGTVMLFEDPILFGEFALTALLVFLLAGMVLRRTTSMHKQEELIQQRSEYEGFLAKAISDEVFLVHFDKEGNMTEVEPLLTRDQTNYFNPVDERHYLNWAKVAHPDDLYTTEQFLKQIRLNQPSVAELRVKMVNDGEFEWRRIYGAPMMHPTDGYVYRAYFASKDIEPEKRAQKEHDEATLERQRVDILKAFSIQSEHQFRTPLSSIHTNLYLLRKVTDAEKRTRYIDNIEAQARLLLELVESLSLLTQIEIREELTEYQIHLNDIVQGLLPTYVAEANAKNVQVQAVLSQDLPKMRGSHLFIKSSVQHLLRNAVSYTPEGGHITVSTRVGKLDSGAKAIELVVEDTGVGMNNDVLEHAFERFYRADVAQTTSGLGLGLPLVKEVAVHYGGQIKLFSTPGKGTVAVFSLPV